MFLEWSRVTLLFIFRMCLNGILVIGSPRIPSQCRQATHGDETTTAQGLWVALRVLQSSTKFKQCLGCFAMPRRPDSDKEIIRFKGRKRNFPLVQKDIKSRIVSLIYMYIYIYMCVCTAYIIVMILYVYIYILIIT